MMLPSICVVQSLPYTTNSTASTTAAVSSSSKGKTPAAFLRIVIIRRRILLLWLLHFLCGPLADAVLVGGTQTRRISRFFHGTVEFVGFQRRRGVPSSSSAAASEHVETSTCTDDCSSIGRVVPNIIRHRRKHMIQGLECVAVTIHWPRCLQRHHWMQQKSINVTIVEATAQSQAVLVDQALENESTLPRDSDVYGAVLWPASLVLAERLALWLQQQQQQQQQPPNPKPKQYKILEVGAGTGLVSLAACRAGAHSVLATDYQELPLQLLQYAAQHLNHHDDNNSNNNSNMHALHTAHFDLCDYLSTPLPRPPPDAALRNIDSSNNNNNDDDDFTWMVAADVLYEPATGVALAHRVVEALKRGMKVWIADSPGRPGRAALLQTLHELWLLRGSGNDTTTPLLAFRNVTGWTVTGDRHELICGPNSSSVARTNTTNATDSTTTTTCTSTPPKALTVSLLELDPALHYFPSLSHRQ